jgi:TP901 family phage tail tape measure protein
LAINSRDLWVVLKAQDQATRALNSYSRAVRDAGNATRIAQIEAQQASLRSQLAAGRLTGMTNDQRNAIKANIAAMEAQQAQLRANDKAQQSHAESLQRTSNMMRSVSQTAYALGFAISAGSVAGVLALHKTLEATIEYDRQVRLTATQIANFSGNLEEVGNIGKRVANTIGVGFQEIQPALFDIFSSMDVNISEAERLLNGFAKAAVAGQTDIQSVSRGTIGILNSFHLSADQINHVLDLQFKFIQKGVGTYDEWAKRIGLVSPSAVRAGQSLETMIAALAVASRMSGVAARAGTAVARAFDAISNANAEKALKKFGVAVQDAHGNFRPFVDIMFDFRKQLDKIPGEAAKAAKIQEIFKGAGGTIEARRFLNNLLLTHGTLEDFKNILDDTANSAGSLDKAYALMSGSTAAKTELLKNKFQLLKIAVGDALMPTFGKLIDIVSKVVDWFNNLSPSTQSMIANFALFATVVGLVLGPLLLFLGLLASVVAAFAAAGTVILATLAIFAGIGVAVAAIIGAFLLLQKNAATFKPIFDNIKESVGGTIAFLKQIAQDFGKAWDEHVAPALDRLSTLIKDKVIPAISEFMGKLNDAVIPKIQEAGRIIGDILGKAFQFIGFVINSVVIPALSWLANFWEQNKATIEPLLPILGQLVKWFLIIAAVVVGVLAVAIIGPLVTAFAALGAIIGVAIVAIILAINWIKMMWTWVVIAATAIKDAFVVAWTAVVSFLSAVWQQILAVVMGGLSILQAGWNAFWNAFGGLIKAVWNLIISIISLGIAAGAFIVLWTLRGLQNAWNAIWNAVATYVKLVWQGISAFFSAIWSVIGGTVTGAARNISNFLSGIWTTIKSLAVSAWNALYNAIADKVNAAKNAVSDAIGKIKGFFSGAGSMLFNAGKNIIQGLIDGIASMINSLTSKINSITKIITDHLPHSPAKKGPLSGRGDPMKAGARIAQRLADGMASQTYTITTASSKMAGAVSYGAANGSVGTTALPVGQAANGGPFTVNVYPKTSVADPKVLGSEIGWQIENRLGVA